MYLRCLSSALTCVRIVRCAHSNTWRRTMRDLTLLSIVARVDPEVWDVIPRGLSSKSDSVALNPQPLPPRETLQIAAAEMAHGIVRIAIEAELGGGSSAEFVNEFIDDWCATPWPRRWPHPWPGPVEGPSPVPWDVRTARVVGAIVFASAGSRLPEGDLGAAFAEGAERLAEAAVVG